MGGDDQAQGLGAPTPGPAQAGGERTRWTQGHYDRYFLAEKLEAAEDALTTANERVRALEAGIDELASLALQVPDEDLAFRMSEFANALLSPPTPAAADAEDESRDTAL